MIWILDERVQLKTWSTLSLRALSPFYLLTCCLASVASSLQHDSRVSHRLTPSLDAERLHGRENPVGKAWLCAEVGHLRTAIAPLLFTHTQHSQNIKALVDKVSNATVAFVTSGMLSAITSVLLDRDKCMLRTRTHIWRPGL